jgi:hypothetical protein
VFLEEAHEYLPQRVMRDETHVVNVWSKLVKQGRFRGLGVTLISQRSASLNKDVLTQIDSLIVLRTTSPQDRAAVRAWVDEQDCAHELIASLPGLANGEAWIWSPEFLHTTERFMFRRRRTFDSGATPTFDSPLPDVAYNGRNVDAIKQALADIVARANANDPAYLRTVIQRVIAERDDLAEQLAAKSAPTRVDDASRAYYRLRANLQALLDDNDGDAIEEGAVASGNSWPEATKVIAAAVRQDSGQARTDDPAKPLGKAERAILNVLNQYPGGRTASQIALQTGYSATASTIGVALSQLRRRGYAGPGPVITSTPEGIAALPVEPLPRGQALLDMWCGQLGKAERTILALLVSRWPRALSQDIIAAETGYSPSASTIGVAMSTLRRLELVDKWRLTNDFAQAILLNDGA